MRRAPLARTAFKSKLPSESTGVLRVHAQEIKATARKEVKRRTRKCALSSCRKPFDPRTATHVCCSTECALAHVDERKAKADRSETRGRLAALKSRAAHLKDAQAAFNAYIRARDAALPCVSCGRFHDGAWDAGHYRSVGAMPALRFHELNCHKQCVPCNQHKAGNIVEYRIGLVKRIGPLAVEWLEMDHPPAKYNIDEAKEIKAAYRKKLKELQA